MAADRPSPLAPGPYLPRPDAGSCGYCGAALDSRWYFCLRCATPWQDEDRVVSRVRPVVPTAAQLVRERAPIAMPLFWTYFAVILGGSIVSWAVIGEEVWHLRLLLLDALLFVTTCYFALSYGRSLLPQLSRIGFERWEAWAGLLALAPLLAIDWAWHKMLSGVSGVHVVDTFQSLRERGFSEGTLVAMICVFPAINEEIAFRGLLQHWLQLAVRPAVAVGLAAALFAAVHFSVVSFPYLFLAGCLLGWVKLRTGSLYPSMVLHFLHNLIVLETFRF